MYPVNMLRQVQPHSQLPQMMRRNSSMTSPSASPSLSPLHHPQGNPSPHLMQSMSLASAQQSPHHHPQNGPPPSSMHQMQGMGQQNMVSQQQQQQQQQFVRSESQNISNLMGNHLASSNSDQNPQCPSNSDDPTGLKGGRSSPPRPTGLKGGSSISPKNSDPRFLAIKTGIHGGVFTSRYGKFMLKGGGNHKISWSRWGFPRCGLKGGGTDKDAKKGSKDDDEDSDNSSVSPTPLNTGIPVATKILQTFNDNENVNDTASKITTNIVSGVDGNHNKNLNLNNQIVRSSSTSSMHNSLSGNIGSYLENVSSGENDNKTSQIGNRGILFSKSGYSDTQSNIGGPNNQSIITTAANSILINKNDQGNASSSILLPSNSSALLGDALTRVSNNSNLITSLTAAGNSMVSSNSPSVMSVLGKSLQSTGGAAAHNMNQFGNATSYSSTLMGGSIPASHSLMSDSVPPHTSLIGSLPGHNRLVAGSITRPNQNLLSGSLPPPNSLISGSLPTSLLSSSLNPNSITKIRGSIGSSSSMFGGQLAPVSTLIGSNLSLGNNASRLASSLASPNASTRGPVSQPSAFVGGSLVSASSIIGNYPSNSSVLGRIGGGSVIPSSVIGTSNALHTSLIGTSAAPPNSLMSNQVVSQNPQISGSYSSGVRNVPSHILPPHPAKSAIPPSSRHQAIIGIPGGGAIPQTIPGLPILQQNSQQTASTSGGANATSTTPALATRPLPSLPQQMDAQNAPPGTAVRMVNFPQGVRMMMVRPPADGQNANVTSSTNAGQNALLKQLLQNNSSSVGSPMHQQQQLFVVRPAGSHIQQQQHRVVHHPNGAQQQGPQQILVQHHARIPLQQQHRLQLQQPQQVAVQQTQQQQQIVSPAGVSPHPALRQLPPSPTPHLDELFDEDQRNKKRAVAAAVVANNTNVINTTANPAAAGTAQPRRRSQSKENVVKNGAPGVPNPRRNKPEEDYDTFLDNLMSQLRSMPPLSVLEPVVYPNFNVCPIYGSGEISKLGRPDHDHLRGKLEGKDLGDLIPKDCSDFYDTKPFGSKLPMIPPPATVSPRVRGFYSMEFPPAKIGASLDETCDEVASLTSTSIGGCHSRPSSSLSTSVPDSPDTVISASSPETALPESPPNFRGLRLIDMDEEIPDRCSSPTIPLLLPIPIMPKHLPKFTSGNFAVDDHGSNEKSASLVKEEPKIKVELNEMEESETNSKSDAVEVKKIKDNSNVKDGFASIVLKNRVGENPALPLKHEGNVKVELTISSNASEDIASILRSLANILNIPPPKVYDVKTEGAPPKISKMWKLPDVKKEIDVQRILNGRVRFCKRCSRIADGPDCIKQKVSDLPHINREQVEGIDELTFCARDCLIQFTMAHKINVASTLPLKEELDNKMDMDVDGERGLKRKFVQDDDEDDDSDDEFPIQADGKRFKTHKYRVWNNESMLPEKKKNPTDREMTDLLFKMAITYRKQGLPQDSRRCTLCQLYGDCVADGPSRLLNYDLDKWVHLNCALWSEDVYETIGGALVHVETGMKKALTLACEACQNLGASVKCFKTRCSKVYHLNCAVKEGCTFYKDKSLYCHEHSTKGDKEKELATLAAWRRVCIDRDENRQIASVMHHTELNHVLRFGSLILLNIGQLLPSQLQAFHTPYCIYPVGFKVIRHYWSMRLLHKRCAYVCSIHEVEGQPEFEIMVVEDGHDDLKLVSRSPKGVWTKVLTPITEMRQAADLVKLFPQYISGEDLFGLTEPAIVRILESMPGVDTLSDYNFKFGRNPLFELPLAVNPTGCARTEPFNKTMLKRYHVQRTSAGSMRPTHDSRNAAALANLSMTVDYVRPFAQTRQYHYKKMKNEWRSMVYLARSKIQGLGLYAARDIEKNTMIIEYIGEVIRAELAEVREKRYEAASRGVYMFSLGDNYVVDASQTGGLARYVNHSCDPSCYTEIIQIEKDRKIAIISNRKIMRGEELAYDYKFDEEEDSKIACMCGADNCRKWMN